MLARKILISLLVGYPKWKVRCSVAAEFPLAKMLRLSIEQVGLQEIQEGGSASDAPFENHLLLLDLHTQQITLLPTSTEELSIPPAVLFTKDQRRSEERRVG